MVLFNLVYVLHKHFVEYYNMTAWIWRETVVVAPDGGVRKISAPTKRVQALIGMTFKRRVSQPRSLAEFWRDHFNLRPSGIVAACVCVRVSVNQEFVRAITRQPFKLGSLNLDQRCKRPWLRALLFCGMIDCDLQGQIELQSKNLPHFELVLAITHHQLTLQFQNLEPKFILALFRSLPILGLIESDLQFNFYFKPRPNWDFMYIIGIL